MPRVVQQPDKSLDSLKNYVICFLRMEKSEISTAQEIDEIVIRCCSKRISNLTNMLTTVLNDHFGNWINKLNSLTGDSLLDIFEGFCKTYMLTLKYFPKNFGYYDSKISKNDDCITNIIQREFSAAMFAVESTFDNLISLMVRNYRSQRNSDNNSISQLANIMGVFYGIYENKTLDLKSNIVEKLVIAFESAIREYYSNMFQQKYSNEQFIEFLKQMKSEVEKEFSLLSSIFKKEEVNRLLNFILDTVFFQNEHQFCQKQLSDFDNTPEKLITPPVDALLHASNMSSSSWLIEQCYRKFGAPYSNITDSLCRYIQSKILSFLPRVKLCKSEKDNVAIVLDIITFISDKTPVYNSLFGFDKDSVQKMKSSIKKAWNREEFSISEYFSLYIDSVVTSQYSNFTEEKKEAFPELVALFLSYTEDFAAFSKFYEHQFLGRFLKYGLKLKPIEEPIIQIIRIHNSPSFLKDFNKFFDFAATSKTFEDEFKASVELSEDQKRITFAPLIMPNVNYTRERFEAKELPQAIQVINDKFCEFFSKKKNGNSYLNLMSDVTLIETRWKVPANRKNKKVVIYRITTDVICARLLHYIFERKNSTYESISEEFSSCLSHVNNYISKLVKMHILARTSTNKKLSPEDVFSMNEEFTSNSQTIQISSLMKSKAEAKKKVQEDIALDRATSIKAAIVYRLKQRGSLTQANLETLIMEYLVHWFKPDVSQMRNCIKELEGEYWTPHIVNGQEELKYVS